MYALPGPPHEMSYPTDRTLQDGGTRPQETPPRRPHKAVHFAALSNGSRIPRTGTAMLTAHDPPLECTGVPPAGAAYFILSPRLLRCSAGSSAVLSHLLPTYARAELAFERGE